MKEKKHLYILWTNGDAETAEKMVFMYGINALRKGWWEEVTLIVWGSPARVVSESPLVQGLIRKALDQGVMVSACRACADQYGVTAQLEELGIEVIYWGEPLTRILKEEETLLTI